MGIIGPRELRQDASALLRRVEQGEKLVVTVSGRPSASIAPTRETRWRG